ncbi:MAG: rhamnan synthesis F family protein [Acidiferrobacterales bacterium]|nr:rhamnan synthesis F family protein [Acidiferrobacterales bacterium]
MTRIHVVLVEWMGYPIFRKKKLGENTVKCGIGRLLQNIQKYPAGVEFECTVIVNRDPDRHVSPFLGQILRVPFVRRLLERSVATNSEEKYQEIANRYDYIDRVIFRDNIGQDIGAYNEAHQLLLQSKFDGDVVFINSSVCGPSHSDWLKKYQELFYRNSRTGICGISMNALYEKFDPHVQSFFLYTNMNVLREVFPTQLVDKSALENKRSLIFEGEAGISRKVLEAGYGICCTAFPDFFFLKGDEWAITRSDIRFLKAYRQFANAI